MDLLEALTRGLARPFASEFAVTSGRLPCVKVNGAFEPVTNDPVTTDLILVMLATLGGLKYIDALGSEPSQWRTEVDGIGPLTVVAVRSGQVVKARCVMTDPARSLDLDVPPKAGPKAPPNAPAKEPPAKEPPRIELDLLPEGTPPAVPLEAPREPDPWIDLGPLLPETDTASLAVLLADARRRGVSDLHVVAGRPPLYRLADELLPYGEVLEPHIVLPMLLACIPPRLRAAFDKEQTCDFALQDAVSGRFRVNVTVQRTGLKGCFRLIGRDVPTLESLGLPAAIAQATEHHQGLIVITGPTGHGKTSTLAALVNLLNSTTSRHIITVEDPIEYVHPRKRAMISQRELGSHTRSFAAALKASLREDPDVIVVGELRDTETVRMAMSASETGHLVLGTMNTPSAAKTIDRLIDLFPPGDQPQVRMMLAGGLRLIVSQRLVRSADGKRVHAAAEILPGNVPLWNLIREAKTFQIPSLQQRGKGLGIVRLDDSLAELVQSGHVTLEAAQTLAEAPDELAAQLGRAAKEG